MSGRVHSIGNRKQQQRKSMDGYPDQVQRNNPGSKLSPKRFTLMKTKIKINHSHPEGIYLKDQKGYIDGYSVVKSDFKNQYINIAMVVIGANIIPVDIKHIEILPVQEYRDKQEPMFPSNDILDIPNFSFLKKVREDLEIEMREVCMHCDLSIFTLSKFENGRNTSLRNYTQLVSFYKTKIKEDKLQKKLDRIQKELDNQTNPKINDKR